MVTAQAIDLMQLPENMQGSECQRANKYLRLSGVPKKYLSAETSRADRTAWDLASGFLRRESVYLWGETGVGKSCLATLFVRERMKSHLQRVFAQNEGAAIEYVPPVMLFVFVPDLIISLKSTWKKSSMLSEQDIIDQYRYIPCLFMDDIGTEETHELSIMALTAVIDYRSREGKQTIYTSNLNIEALAKKLGDRIASRITGMCGGGQNVVELKGADRRIAQQEELICKSQ